MVSAAVNRSFREVSMHVFVVVVVVLLTRCMSWFESPCQ